MDDLKKCLCCGRNRPSMAICFKSGDEVSKIRLCERCFQIYKIDADFLQTCLDHGPGADFRPFRELQDEKEAEIA